jgi:hypothetical protein
MRIPYPERLPYSWATAFAAVLLAVQLLEHTDLTFAVCSFCYILVATAAFNLAGGLYRAAGAFIFFNATLTLIIGLVAKAVLNEAANSNLYEPNRAIEVYLFGMVGMLAAAYIENRFRPARGLVTRLFPVQSLRTTYLAATFIGVAFNLYLIAGPPIPSESIFNTLRNSNFLLPFAVLIGVIHTVQSSNGKKSMTLLLFVIIALTSVFGLIVFSKQSFYTPTFCWLLGVGIARYQLKPFSIIVFGATVFIMLYFGTPVIQLGKSMSTGNFFTDIPVAVGLLENFKTTRAEYEESSAAGYGKVNYFNKPEGLLDRLQMIAIDDLLISEADRNGFYGYSPFTEGLENLIPHILWKDKPNLFFGNVYAHQIGVLGENDTSTGVSFSASADAYKEGGFTGVLIMEPFCFLLIFCIASFVTGDIRENPAAIIMILIAGHLAPEGMIPGALQYIDYVLVVLEFAIFCRYIAPVVTSALVPSPAPLLPDLASAID